MKVFLTGLPGSGKTTIGVLIAERYGLCLIKTGEILRGMAKGEGEVAKSLQQVMATGTYADDGLVAEVAKEKMGEPGCKRGFVMDGYPRRQSQLKLFNPGFDAVIYLGVSEQEAVERLLARGRADDTKEIIEKRMAEHQREIEPMLGLFETTGKLHRVNAERNVVEVFESVCGVLDEIKEGG